MKNNFITEYLGKIYKLSKTTSPAETLLMIKNLEEIIKKRIEADKNMSDPNRLQEFETSDGPSNSGFGSM